MANHPPSFFACLWRYPLASLHSSTLSFYSGALGACALLFALHFSDQDFWRALVFGAPNLSVGAALGLLALAAHLGLCLSPASRRHIQPPLNQGFPSAAQAFFFWSCLPIFLTSSIVGDAIARQPRRIENVCRPGLSLIAQLRASLGPLSLVFFLSAFLALMMAKLCAGMAFAALECAQFAMSLAAGQTLPPPALHLEAGHWGWVVWGAALWLLPVAIHGAQASRGLAWSSMFNPRACASALWRPFGRAGRGVARRVQGARDHVLAQGQRQGVHAQAERKMLESKTPLPPSRTRSPRL